MTTNTATSTTPGRERVEGARKSMASRQVAASTAIGIRRGAAHDAIVRYGAVVTDRGAVGRGDANDVAMVGQVAVVGGARLGQAHDDLYRSRRTDGRHAIGAERGAVPGILPGAAVPVAKDQTAYFRRPMLIAVLGHARRQEIGDVLGSDDLHFLHGHAVLCQPEGDAAGIADRQRHIA